jgi:hypothetical protein
LALSFLEVLLKILQVRKVVSVLFLQVLHLAQKHKLLLVNDLLGSLSKIFISLELIVVETQFSLILLPVDLHLKFVDAFLERI